MGIGDDAALINSSPNQQLVVASDTLVEDVHFPAAASPRQIASRALCVNLSDMAAMGAQPRWFTLALTLPEDKANSEWLGDFSAGLAELANQFDVALIGGDTTSGPLTLSLTLLGEVPAGQSLQRSGAGIGDSVFVTGSLGDGAAGLKTIYSKYSDFKGSDRLLQRFYQPLPQVQAGLFLRGIASACIDISDGLVADLGHICQSSRVAARIYIEQLPIAADVRALAPDDCVNWALFGGDDYQLCFTVSSSNLSKIEQMIACGELTACNIGTIEVASDSTNLVTVINSHNNPIISNKKGYDHFGRQSS